MPPFAQNGSVLNGLGNGAARRGPNGTATTNLAVDNMIRNQLKVSDVRDPKQIADALLNHYKDLPIAAAVREEAQGLPNLPVPVSGMLPPPQPTSSDAEFNIADGDVEKALNDLTTNPLTNDIVPEMQGWADSIRRAVVQGHTAARNGLDPTQRDLVLATRRQLGEYARMARFVGSMSPAMTFNYRRLAQGLDEVAAVLLVILGESLASVGFASGYYLLQVPLAEVQQRRDAVIFALRNFMGGAQEAYGPNDWPRGIDAYRRIYKWLEEQGQGDLRSLLIENEIAQTMDALISRAQNGTAEGLRALGVTAQLDVERFRRMVIVASGALGRDNGYPDRSPPLEAYLQALELFSETFRPAGGLRLLRIARPAILFYGLYNPNLLEHDQDLLQLIIDRGYLGTLFDTLFPGAGARTIEPQVLLDMILLEIDRAMDLLALGPEPQENQEGWTERRAIAYWLIINVVVNVLKGTYIPPQNFVPAKFPTVVLGGPAPQFSLSKTNDVVITDSITFLAVTTFPSTVNVYFSRPVYLGGAGFLTSPVKATVVAATSPGTFEITLSQSSSTVPATVRDERLLYAYPTTSTLQSVVPPTQVAGPIMQKALEHKGFANTLWQIYSAYTDATKIIPNKLSNALGKLQSFPLIQGLKFPLKPDAIIPVGEELFVQESLEKRWKNLVRTVAPEAGEQESIFGLLELVIKQAMFDAQAGDYDARKLLRDIRPQPLPPQYEQSLELIARRVG